MVGLGTSEKGGEMPRKWKAGWGAREQEWPPSTPGQHFLRRAFAQGSRGASANPLMQKKETESEKTRGGEIGRAHV